MDTLKVLIIGPMIVGFYFWYCCHQLQVNCLHLRDIIMYIIYRWLMHLTEQGHRQNTTYLSAVNKTVISFVSPHIYPWKLDTHLEETFKHKSIQNCTYLCIILMQKQHLLLWIVSVLQYLFHGYLAMGLDVSEIFQQISSPFHSRLKYEG